MNVEKTVLSQLEKCYSIGAIRHGGHPAILVGSETCPTVQLFDRDGALLETFETAYGGKMTLAAVPGREDAFLCTERFYSPNDSHQARIVLVEKTAAGWESRVLADFDGDGQLELGCISPFHGASLTIYHLDDCGSYVPRWKYPAPEAETAFLHATWAAPLLGRMCWVVGWRAGSRQTVAISYDPARGDYVTALLDSGAGCANAMAWVDGAGRDCVVAANREIDQVALYRLQNSDGLW